MRAVQGLIGVGWLLLAWLLGLTMSPNWKFELEFTTLTCLAIAAATFAVLIVFRCFSGKMLVQTDGMRDNGTKRFQYSLTTLLLVMLLICVTFALFGWIDRRYLNDAALRRAQSLWYFGLLRKEMEWEVLKAVLRSVLIAATCLPVYLSRRKRSFAWTLGLSTVAIIVTVLTDTFARTNILYPFFQGKPVQQHFIDYYFVHHITNLATVTLCLLSAALAARWLGYRISKA